MPEEQTSHEGAPGRPMRKHVYVDIQEADGHYVASFSHGPPKVFHSINQVLMAIGEEVKKLSP